MFDFHLHSNISFDSDAPAIDIVKKAEFLGLKEICFTDHYDYNSDPQKTHNIFTIDEYKNAYKNLSSSTVTIRKGIEYGLTTWNKPQLNELLSVYDFDFVIGSIHFVNGYDPYDAEYWEGNTVNRAIEKYFEETLKCLKIHDDFDVLGHLTYVCKYAPHALLKSVNLKDFINITDEIMKELIEKGRGIEINTSGIDKIGEFLPSADFLKRFKELGGEIVTVGTDSHDARRVGQHTDIALEIIKNIFGYVCTFEKRKPVFHKL